MSKPLKSELVILPYYVVDAWIERWSRAIEAMPVPLSIQRIALSSGSARYNILNAKKRVFGWLEVVALSPTTAQVEVWLSPTTPQREQKIATTVLDITFSSFIDVFEKGAVQAIHTERMLDSLRALDIPGADRPRGAAPNSDNEWAREQIAAGRDREEVYREWLTRRKFDLSKPDQERLAKDTFRKAIARKRTDGRKE